MDLLNETDMGRQRDQTEILKDNDGCTESPQSETKDLLNQSETENQSGTKLHEIEGENIVPLQAICNDEDIAVLDSEESEEREWEERRVQRNKFLRSIKLKFITVESFRSQSTKKAAIKTIYNKVIKAMGGKLQKLPAEILTLFRSVNPYRVYGESINDTDYQAVTSNPLSNLLTRTNSYTSKSSLARPHSKNEAASENTNEFIASNSYSISQIGLDLSEKVNQVESVQLQNMSKTLSSHQKGQTAESEVSLVSQLNKSKSHSLLKSNEDPSYEHLILKQKVRYSDYSTWTYQSFLPNTFYEESLKLLEKPVEKFIRKAWLVYLLCKVCLVLRRYAFEGGLDPRTFEAAIPHTGLRPKNQLSLFLPADFKMVGRTNWQQSVWESILSPIGHRSETDLMQIQNIMKAIKEFVDYPKAMQQEICQYIRYERFGKNRVIIRRGDFGYQYYYILSGTVEITYASNSAQLFSKGDSIKKLGKGESFGEQAVMRVPSPRTATIICSKNCEFLIIDSDYFDVTGLTGFILARIEERYKLIRSFPLVESWSDHKVRKLSFSGATEYYRYNEIVVTEAEQNDFVYGCLKGSCDIIKAVDLNSSSTFGALCRPQTFKRLRHAQRTCTSQSGRSALTNSEEQFSEVIKWWPDQVYEDKYMQIKKKFERNLGLSREVSVSQRLNLMSDSISSLASEGRRISDSLYPSSPTSGKHISNKSGKGVPERKQIHRSQGAYITRSEGVYVKVGELIPGYWFGLQDIWGMESNRCLVSRGSYLVRIPKSRINEMLTVDTVRKLRQCLANEYIHTDGELSQEALSQLLWKSAVTDIGKEISIHQHNKCQATALINLIQLTSFPKDRDYTRPEYYNQDPLLKKNHQSNKVFPMSLVNTSKKALHTAFLVDKLSPDKNRLKRRLSNLKEHQRKLSDFSNEKGIVTSSKQMRSSGEEHEGHLKLLNPGLAKDEYKSIVRRLVLKTRIATMDNLNGKERESGKKESIERKRRTVSFDESSKSPSNYQTSNSIGSSHPVINVKPRLQHDQHSVRVSTIRSSACVNNGTKTLQLVTGIISPVNRICAKNLLAKCP